MKLTKTFLTSCVGLFVGLGMSASAMADDYINTIRFFNPSNTDSAGDFKWQIYSNIPNISYAVKKGDGTYGFTSDAAGSTNTSSADSITPLLAPDLLNPDNCGQVPTFRAIFVKPWSLQYMCPDDDDSHTNNLPSGLTGGGSFYNHIFEGIIDIDDSTSCHVTVENGEHTLGYCTNNQLYIADLLSSGTHNVNATCSRVTAGNGANQVASTTDPLYNAWMCTSATFGYTAATRTTGSSAVEGGTSKTNKYLGGLGTNANSQAMLLQRDSWLIPDYDGQINVLNNKDEVSVLIGNPCAKPCWAAATSNVTTDTAGVTRNANGAAALKCAVIDDASDFNSPSVVGEILLPLKGTGSVLGQRIYGVVQTSDCPSASRRGVDASNNFTACIDPDVSKYDNQNGYKFHYSLVCFPYTYDLAELEVKYKVFDPVTNEQIGADVNKSCYVGDPLEQPGNPTAAADSAVFGAATAPALAGYRFKGWQRYRPVSSGVDGQTVWPTGSQNLTTSGANEPSSNP